MLKCNYSHLVGVGTMANNYGGYRAGSGRKPKPVKVTPILGVTNGVSLTPLEYALAIMNDASQSDDRRDKMAIAILPYCQSKMGELGIKAKAQDHAQKVSRGKFAPSSAPKLVVDNT